MCRMIVHLCQTTSLSFCIHFPFLSLFSSLPVFILCISPYFFYLPSPSFSSSSSLFLLSSPPSFQVITLHRPLRCCHWCCFCCLQEVEVQSPPGSTIGYIQQDFTLFYPWFSIQNEDRETLLKLKGPCCYTCGDVEFEVRAVCLSVWAENVEFEVRAVWGCLSVCVQ